MPNRAERHRLGQVARAEVLAYPTLTAWAERWREVWFTVHSCVGNVYPTITLRVHGPVG